MRKILFAIIILLMAFGQAFSQTQTNTAELQRLATKFQAKWNADRAEVLKYAKDNNVPIRIENDSVTMEMQYIDEFGIPQYYITENKNAAATISTNKVNTGGSLGLTLDGSGMTLREWDGGAVLSTHQEFGSRVVQGDGASTTHYHATHVAGTMIASGVDGYAKGMAPMANLRAFYWDNDESEMASEAASNSTLVSNHSYGYGRGWSWDGTSWSWLGTPSVSDQEDYLFGLYDQQAKDWDEIAYNAPNYLIVKSAGNDRGDGPDNPAYPLDGPYDCISHASLAKNILTVGAAEDIIGSYDQPSDVRISSFSSWGPVDDGRIKPDIVANGVGLYSTFDGSNTDYSSISGTSMAAPNAAGSLILLQEHHEDLNGSENYMRSATLKALVIHTANEAGSDPGPDYIFGWGLMNTRDAAKKIIEDQSNDVIREQTLANGGTYTTTITATSGFPIKVTVVWTDPIPSALPPGLTLDPSTKMLVNDLDLSVSDQSSNIHYPWKLSRTSPANAATRTNENNVDNVEVVLIENPTPGETYTISVDHDGTLASSQNFSMIISGYPIAPTANFFADKNSCQLNETVSLTDLSTENPTSWSWSINPATYTFVNSTSASSQNPEIEFTASGTYDITLIASNAAGSNTESKSGYIAASDAPSGYCAAYSTNPAGIIENFSFAGVENYHTGYSDIGGGQYYQDFTNIMIDVNRLGSYSLYVLNGYDGAGEDLLDLTVWIDYNRDGDFEDNGEQVVCDIDDYGEGTFNVVIPADASLGSTRMRARVKYTGSDCGNPCGSTGNGEVEDYLVNILPVPVLPPEADFTADNTTPSINSTVIFTDLSTNVPTSWLWSFTPNTVNFVGGTSATSQNPQVEFTELGDYDVTLYAENAHGNDTKIKSAYITGSPISYCTASGGGDEYIGGVTIESINNTGTGSDGYQDYTNLVAHVDILKTYPVTISNGTFYATDDLGIWVDWNQDGDFDDIDENIVCDVDNGGEGTFNVTIPATAKLGTTRARLRIKYFDSDCGGPCGATTYGEVEDYTVHVHPGTLTWDGSESTDWDDPDNWDGGIVPTDKFHAIIPDASTVTFSPIIGSGQSVMCTTCTLQQGANLTSVGNLTLLYSE